MHKGITPTFTLTLPEDIDLTDASHVYVTFSDKKGRKKVTMTEEALDIDVNVIRATLRQEDTLKMSQMYIQVNWTYIEGGVTKTATASNYPTSLSFTSMKGEPKMFAVHLNAQVSSSGSTTYYYIVDIISHGTTTHGNCFRIGSTRRVDQITSGYSWSYAGTTLTISSSAASRSASPGAFYSGSYELLYVY